MEKLILDYLKNNKGFVNSITNIAKGIEKNRMSVSKFLAVLEAKNKVTFKRKGMQKVWSIK